MPKSKSQIPDRWKDYSNIGEVIEGTQLITFKVPLRQSIPVEADLKFTPSMLMETLESRNLRLGHVIDLTFTTRYYNSAEFTENGVGYTKIFVPGHVIPADDIFQSFVKTVEDFNAEKEENADNLIGVHCTHGLNRTGYMVCRYMIEKLGIDPSVAIKESLDLQLVTSSYGDARGYPIERENYIEDLHKRTPGVCTLGLSKDSNQGNQKGSSKHTYFDDRNPNIQHHHGNNRGGWHSNNRTQQDRRGHYNDRPYSGNAYNGGYYNDGYGANRPRYNDGRGYNGPDRRSNNYNRGNDRQNNGHNSRGRSYNNYDSGYQQRSQGNDTYGTYGHQHGQGRYDSQQGRQDYNGQQDNPGANYYPKRRNNSWRQYDQ